MRIWRGTKEREKEFIKLFESLNPSLSGWQIWENVISAIACSLSNVAEPNNKRRERREKEYERAISQLGGKVEAVAKLMAILVDQLEEYPEEDFLGEMYMNLNMGNHWTGQFFTPTNVAEMMAYINITDGIKAELKEKGYLSVSDPSCGAGVNLLAAAKAFRRQNVNYQRDVLFVGQDIDRVVAQMCYIQLAIIGAAGYVCVGNTLTNPITGVTDLMPDEKEGQDFWYTPMYWTEQWQLRIFLQQTGFRGFPVKSKPLEKEHFYFQFDFGKENLDAGKRIVTRISTG